MINTEEDPIVERKIGEKTLRMQQSHKLPLYYERFPFYDRALPRISKKVSEIDGYLSFIDIGANIGDTISLITDKVNGSFLCVEGDKNYAQFLKANISSLKNSNVTIEECYCGETYNQSEGLTIHRENGTARLEADKGIVGQDNVKLKSLDNIIKENPLFKETNLLKIDTDGFEINVLKSGGEFIKKCHPLIYFEFDPELYSINHKEPLIIFDFLYEHGYYEALLYDNFGVPVKIISTSNRNEIKSLVKLIDKKKIYYFDVLTFHDSKKSQYEAIFGNELFSCLSSFNDLLHLTQTKLDSVTNELSAIHSSREWRFMRLLRKVRNIFPF